MRYYTLFVDILCNAMSSRHSVLMYWRSWEKDRMSSLNMHEINKNLHFFWVYNKTDIVWTFLLNITLIHSQCLIFNSALRRWISNTLSELNCDVQQKAIQYLFNIQLVTHNIVLPEPIKNIWKSYFTIANP